MFRNNPYWPVCCFKRAAVEQCRRTVKWYPAGI